MGKKKWFNKKKLKNKDGTEKPKRNNVRDGGNQTGYVELLRESKDFEEYYKKQKIVSGEEWESFIGCMKQDLPAAFRLTGSKHQSQSLLKFMLDFFQSIPVEEGTKPLKLFELPWYPDRLAWQLNLTRKDIRRSEAYWKMHQFLIAETETGNISRQEAVSMIPPLLLDVKSNHKVLDMCAAPGSKTAQIIEILHSTVEGDSPIPPGIVVANDVDNKRCYMLTHQAKRLQSPTLLITNHDAASMPNISHTRADGTVGPIKFDRILCDVPCSGDGTLRKNFDVWSKWNAVNGANLHGLQMRIARRGLEMLKVGGRMVYSTCSLNPLENEAVVNRLLTEFGASVNLVDVASSLAGLKYCPGLEEWTVTSKDLEVIPSGDEIPPQHSNYLHKHLFPPSLHDRPDRNLNRCIRILPHHQDTGAFFVAVFEKRLPLPGEKVYDDTLKMAVEEIPEEGNRVVTQSFKPPPKKRVCRGYKEEPFYYASKDDPMWETILKFYGFDDALDVSLFLTRVAEGSAKNVYFTNALVKDVVMRSEAKIKIINTGVKVLVRCDNKGSECQYRLAQEGLQTVSPLLGQRRMELSKEDFIAMLTCEDTNLPPQIDTLHPNTQEQCGALDCGSVVFCYDGEGFKAGVDLRFELVGWKGKNSVRSYVVKEERVHFLRLLGHDVSAFVKNKFLASRNGGGVVPSRDDTQASKDESRADPKTTQNGAGPTRPGDSSSTQLNDPVAKGSVPSLDPSACPIDSSDSVT